MTFAQAAGGAGQYGFVEAMKQGGPVAWATLAIMILMFVGSLYILFTKLFEQNKIMKQGRDMAATFWRAPSLAEGAAKLEKNSAYRQIVEDGLRAQADHGKLSDPVEAHDWMHGTMERSQNQINSVLSGGLSFLATVGATAPFVGLFGTVWGILNALLKIAQSGDPSITVVAGPVGEALIMTAIGLVVAVPAVMAYNWLQARNKQIARDLGTFANDVLGNIMSGGAVRPAVTTAAPAAAPAKKA
nr:MotA/TolQ/ExbB proton channel family protein [Sphingomonas lacunae]